MNLLNCDLAKEVLTVLSCFKDFKIADELLIELTNLAALSKKDFYIDANKELNSQDISEECKDYLSFLYYKSLGIEKQKLIFDKWVENTKIEIL